MAPLDGPILFYDGVCGLCAALVRWFFGHEADPAVRFAPLQGETCVRARARYANIPRSIDTAVFVTGGRAHLRSKAILYAARHLRSPWRWAYHLRWLPGPLLNVGYRLVAALRYRIWGHADACGLATPAQRARMLP